MLQLNCFNCGNIIEDAKPQIVLKNGQRKPVCKVCYTAMTSKNQADEGKTEYLRNKQQPEIPGWLIVHDENTKSQILDLKAGENVIGRLAKTNGPDVGIDTTDMYMSRHHCIISVIEGRDGAYQFLLSDKKMSINGTFHNINHRRLTEEDIVYIHDGDVVQLGETKVILKINKDIIHKEQVHQEVSDSPYAPTVMIRRN